VKYLNLGTAIGQWQYLGNSKFSVLVSTRTCTHYSCILKSLHSSSVYTVVVCTHIDTVVSLRESALSMALSLEEPLRTTFFYYDQHVNP
jgi:hypothetical protein